MASRDDVWALIRVLRSFTVADLDRKTNLDKSSIETYLTGLRKGGYLSREEEPGENTGVSSVRYRYTVVKDSIEAPRIRKDGTEVTQGRGREQMWRAMRILKRFDLATIWAASGTEEHPVARAEAKTYVEYLVRAGYLKQTGKGEKAVYMLVRYTGPRPPQIQRVKRVWDPNLRRVVWPAAESEKSEVTSEKGARHDEAL